MCGFFVRKSACPRLFVELRSGAQLLKLLDIVREDDGCTIPLLKPMQLLDRGEIELPVIGASRGNGRVFVICADICRILRKQIYALLCVQNKPKKARRMPGQVYYIDAGKKLEILFHKVYFF